MRSVAALALAALAGCHSATTPPPPYGLDVDVALATPASAGEVALASVSMRLGTLVAVSDRAAADPRATLDDVDLALGDAHTLSLPTAPPGLYSAVGAQLGSTTEVGVDIQAVWRTFRVHATLMSTPFDVTCATPVRLAPGEKARLRLSADPSGWFDGVDLASATSDVDDAGIVISQDDNIPLANVLRANVVASFTLDCIVEAPAL